MKDNVVMKKEEDLDFQLLKWDKYSKTKQSDLIYI